MKRFFIALVISIMAILAVPLMYVQDRLDSFSYYSTLYVRAFMLVITRHLEAYAFRFGLVLGLNTITNLIPTLYAALDIISRELVGFIPAVSRNSSVERAAVNQTVNIPIVPAIAAGNVTPAATPPDDGDATIGNTTMTISKSRYAPVRWSGEEQLAASGSGMLNVVLTNQFAQAMRTLVNEVETDLAALHIYSSRAFGTYNVAPFGTAADFSDFAGVNQILDDNGAPTSDRQLVLGSAAIANVRGKQSLLFKANEAGTTELLRLGILGMVEGLAIHNSAQVKKSVTVGTSNNAGTTDTTGYAIGSTAITMAAAGTGTIIAGDIVTFTGDTNKYLVATGVASLAAGGVLTLQEPGLRKALAASNVTATVIAATDRSMGFSKSSIQLATRLPALPEGGDMADDRLTITDPISGLSFEVSVYRQYRRVKYEVAIAWGVKCVTPRHTMTLVGPAS